MRLIAIEQHIAALDLSCAGATALPMTGSQAILQYNQRPSREQSAQ